MSDAGSKKEEGRIRKTKQIQVRTKNAE